MGHLLDGRDSGLARLNEQSARLRRLAPRVAALLPAPLGLHCGLANLRGDTLVMQCDSSVWAARLRYLTPQLLRRLAGGGSAPARLQVRVMRPPEAPTPVPPRRPAPRLSPATAELLRRCAEGNDDPKLRAALLRLARRAC